MKLSASSDCNTWLRFCDCLNNSGVADSQPPRTLVLAAHPDDETIGASVPLSSLPDAWVLWVTDGAPRNPSLRSSHHEISREAYAQIRSLESSRALARVGMAADRIASLNCIDQEAIYNIAPLVDGFVSRLRNFRPEIVITHPYEGGHPDHDAAALIAALALDILKQDVRTKHSPGPLLIEMTSYHAVNRQLRTGEFLPCSLPLLVMELTEEQRERKDCMFSSYASQAAVLKSFKAGRELFRPAPVYDFHAAPHEGRLWYECLGWDMTGDQWRSLATVALAQFHQYACR